MNALSHDYPEYIKAPAREGEMKASDFTKEGSTDATTWKPDCSKYCRNYEPVELLTRAEVDRIIDSAKPAIDWHEGDWAFDRDLGLIKLLEFIHTFSKNKWCVECQDSLRVFDNISPARFSIPTPSQLLVEYKGRKCLAWENEGEGITIRYGIGKEQWVELDFDMKRNFDDRIFVPDCLAVVSHDQMKRHYPNGIEYPKGVE